MHGDYKFEPHEYWAGVSETARDFVRACLTVDAKQRPTAEQLLKHKWLADLKPHFVPDPNSTTGEPTDLLPQVRKHFDARKTCECSPCHPLRCGELTCACASTPSVRRAILSVAAARRFSVGPKLDSSKAQLAETLKEYKKFAEDVCACLVCQHLSNDIVHKCRNTLEMRHPPPSPMPTRHRRRPRRTRVARAANSWRSSCPPPMPLLPPLREPQLGPTRPRRVPRPGPPRLRALIPLMGARQAAQPTQKTYKRPFPGRASRIIDAMRGPGSATSDFQISSLPTDGQGFEEGITCERIGAHMQLIHTPFVKWGAIFRPLCWW